MKTSGKEIVNKICLDGDVFTTANSNNSKTTNCFIKTKDGQYYLITKFDFGVVKDFEGKRIKCDPFKFKYKNYELNLDYLFKCEVKEEVFKGSIYMIDRKVHFVRQYVKNSSKAEFERKGYLIDLVNCYHN